MMKTKRWMKRRGGLQCAYRRPVVWKHLKPSDQEQRRKWKDVFPEVPQILLLWVNVHTLLPPALTNSSRDDLDQIGCINMCVLWGWLLRKNVKDFMRGCNEIIRGIPNVALGFCNGPRIYSVIIIYWPQSHVIFTSAQHYIAVIPHLIFSILTRSCIAFIIISPANFFLVHKHFKGFWKKYQIT